MIRFGLATTMAFVTMTAVAVAQVPSAPPPQIVLPSSVPTSRGPALVTGSPGSAQSVMIPASPVPGTLMNNGNGTSNIIVPGSPSQVVPTPR